jgi:cell division transport system permease protein
MNNSQDLPLKNDIAARFLPLIIGLMVYVGTLCFVFTLFILSATHLWENQLRTQITLEVPAPSLQAQVLQVLSKTPGVQQAAAVPKKEVETLLQSLLGTALPVDLQALPVLIEVSLNGREPLDVPTLEAHLKNISPQIQLVDHRPWQTQVESLINASVILASTLTFLVLLTALVTTTFATRTSLLIHRQVIEVLHLIGATNDYIARQFQVHALKQGLIASAVGAAFAFLTFLGITTLLEKAGLPSTSLSSFSLQAFCVFALSPFVTGFFMMLSARLTVMRGLHL